MNMLGVPKYTVNTYTTICIFGKPNPGFQIRVKRSWASERQLPEAMLLPLATIPDHMLHCVAAEGTQVRSAIILNADEDGSAIGVHGVASDMLRPEW
jgi:hypothetical protein